MGATIPPKRTTAGEAAAARPSGPPAGLHVRIGADALPLSTQQASYRECYERHVAEARALPAHTVAVFRGDAALALTNVRVGLDGLGDDVDRMAEHLPKVSRREVTSAADVARALVYATLLAAPAAAGDEFRVRAKRVRALRRQLLAQARTFVDRGVLKAEDVAGVGAGRGPQAMATDAVVLVELFVAREGELRGQHPFARGELDALRADAEWLLETLKPANARARKPKRERTAAGDVDRLWTLLVGRHGTLRRVAHYFHGEAYGDVVPPLLSRTRAKLPAERVDPPAPQPPPAPPVG